MKRPPHHASAALLLAISSACGPLDAPDGDGPTTSQGPLSAPIDGDGVDDRATDARGGATTAPVFVATDPAFPRATLEGEFGPAGQRAGEAGVFVGATFDEDTGHSWWTYEIESTIDLGDDTPLVVLGVAGGLDELGEPGDVVHFDDAVYGRLNVWICTTGGASGAGWDQTRTAGTIEILELEDGVWEYVIQAEGTKDKPEGKGWTSARIVRVVDDES
jgi:hypothetical protein